MPQSAIPPREIFRFCPSCGAPVTVPAAQPFQCRTCDFRFYFNTTCATAAFFVRPDGYVLFIRREKEPAKGKLAVPGGFIDEGETAETGIRREFEEEVGLVPQELTFLCSHPNHYHYRGIVYPVLDFFFVGSATGEEKPEALDAVESVHWLDPAKVDPEEIAFPSLRYALGVYLASR